MTCCGYLAAREVPRRAARPDPAAARAAAQPAPRTAGLGGRGRRGCGTLGREVATPLGPRRHARRRARQPCSTACPPTATWCSSRTATPGLYVPAVAAATPGGRRASFVDAALPLGRPGSTPTAPPALVDHLRPLAGPDGLLPGLDPAGGPRRTSLPCSRSAQVRAEVEAEQARLPLSYFDADGAHARAGPTSPAPISRSARRTTPRSRGARDGGLAGRGARPGGTCTSWSTRTR